MKRHLQLGRAGEMLACSFLKSNGYQVIVQNWRAEHLELDIICLKESQLIFVEVKTARFSIGFFPEMNLTFRKQQHIRQAAAIFFHQNPQYDGLSARFDVVAITIYLGRNPEIYHIEDAFR